MCPKAVSKNRGLSLRTGVRRLCDSGGEHSRDRIGIGCTKTAQLANGVEWRKTDRVGRLNEARSVVVDAN